MTNTYLEEITKAVQWYFGFTKLQAKEYMKYAKLETIKEILQSYNSLRDF